MLVLGIESSCDETAAAVIRRGPEVLSSVISDQIEIHSKFGGVVPELAGRSHAESIHLVIEKALDDAKVTLKSEGTLHSSAISCTVQTGAAIVEAGLHPATGGDGLSACSGNMLLDALVACAGVTLRAVATALEIPVRESRITAEGDLDFRGTLAVDKQVPVGLTSIRLHFELDCDANVEQLESLLKLTERYCVIYQTLGTASEVRMTYEEV